MKLQSEYDLRTSVLDYLCLSTAFAYLSFKSGCLRLVPAIDPPPFTQSLLDADERPTEPLFLERRDPN